MNSQAINTFMRSFTVIPAVVRVTVAANASFSLGVSIGNT